jgi:hydroxypyruvate isomerase
MSGKVESPTAENWTVYEKNIKYATTLLAQNQIIGLIEPINNRSVPHYFMNSYEKGSIKNLAMLYNLITGNILV